MWYVGDNDNEYGLKYGDEVKITPLEENNTELDCFLFELNNLRIGKRLGKEEKRKWNSVMNARLV